MPKQVKSLLVSCQDSLTKSLDGKKCGNHVVDLDLMFSFLVLSEVGCVPYSLLKDSLKHATPQQLYRIERANPVSTVCFIIKEIGLTILNYLHFHIGSSFRIRWYDRNRIKTTRVTLKYLNLELWLKHCLLFKDIRDDFEQGLHRNPKEWRELYLVSLLFLFLFQE